MKRKSRIRGGATAVQIVLPCRRRKFDWRGKEEEIGVRGAEKKKATPSTRRGPNFTVKTLDREDF